MANFLNRYIMRHLFPVFLLIVVGLLIAPFLKAQSHRSEEHTSELQSRHITSYAVFCLKKKNKKESTYI